MKKLLTLLAFFFIAAAGTAFATHPGNPAETQQKATYVYICNSGRAAVYHSTANCRGLSHCTHGIVQVTLNEAINKYHRRACKICE